MKRFATVALAATLLSCEAPGNETVKRAEPTAPSRPAPDPEQGRTLDRLRIRLLDGFETVELATLELARTAAAHSYYQGTDDMCTEILGEDSRRCDEIRAAFQRQDYPGDPGEIPDEVQRDIRRSEVWKILSRLHELVCSVEAWPYFQSTQDPIIDEVCMG